MKIYRGPFEFLLVSVGQLGRAVVGGRGRSDRDLNHSNVGEEGEHHSINPRPPLTKRW